MGEKKLGFGCMRVPLLDPSNNTSADMKQLEAMVDRFLAAGFRYFDTAYMYHDFKSETFVREALVKRHNRDSFLVADKLPLGMLKKKEDVDRIFQEQKEKTGLSYFDFYLMHDMNHGNYLTAKKYGAIDYARAKRQAGEIRHLGFSFHDNAQVLDLILRENPDMEFVQLQINYLDWESQGVQSKKCYQVATEHGIPVIVMEPVKGGTLAKVPQEVEKEMKAMHPDWSVASWAMGFAAGLDNVKMVLSGISNMEQMENNISFLTDLPTFGQEEKELLARACDVIAGKIAVPCTGCRYCVEESSCPMGIPIPNYFALYNTENLQREKGWTPEREYYSNFVKLGNGRASQYIACHKCKKVCPQHIAISEKMQDVTKILEENNAQL